MPDSEHLAVGDPAEGMGRMTRRRKEIGVFICGFRVQRGFNVMVFQLRESVGVNNMCRR